MLRNSRPGNRSAKDFGSSFGAAAFFGAAAAASEAERERPSRQRAFAKEFTKSSRLISDGREVYRRLPLPTRGGARGLPSLHFSAGCGRRPRSRVASSRQVGVRGRLL